MIFEASPGKEQPSEIAENMVGHKENTQVALVVMHEDSLVEESAPELKMPEKVPLHEIHCVITGSNLGPGGRIWKSPSLPDMTAVRAI